MSSRAKMDERTCETCAYLNATDATPPHDGCTNLEDGCRCVEVAEYEEGNGDDDE